jgi:hypothetical protein
MALFLSLVEHAAAASGTAAIARSASRRLTPFIVHPRG